MDIDPVHGDPGRSRVEIFIGDFPLGPAVDRVGIVRSEALDIEPLRAFSDFFIGRESNADFAVADFRVLEEIGHGCHDFRDAGLVVRAEQGGAVRRDQGPSLERRKVGKLHGRKNSAGALEHHIAAVIVFDDLGLYILPGKAGRRVEMGDEAGRLPVLHVRGGRKGAVDVAVVADLGVLYAQSPQLIAKVAGQVELAGRRGNLLGPFLTGCIKGHIVREALLQLFS